MRPEALRRAEACLLRLLIAEGHLDEILVSSDFGLSIETRWCVGLWTWDNPDRTSYAYLHTGVLPKLRAAGLTEAHLQTIMRDSPLGMLRRREGSGTGQVRTGSNAGGPVAEDWS